MPEFEKNNKYSKKRNDNRFDRGQKQRTESKPFDKKDKDEINEECGTVYGRNPVNELLSTGRAVDKIFVKQGDREGFISVIVAKAAAKGITVCDADIRKLDRLALGGNHQGVVALTPGIDYFSIEDMIADAKEKGEDPFILMLDSIEDPHNLGAIIRSAECAGVHGIIIPKHRSATITPVVYKTAAGALEYMKIAKVTNLNQAVEKLKKLGLWVYGAEAGGELAGKCDLKGPICLVMGSEGQGISRALKENCDKIVSIPMYGRITSLNVSAAAAVLMYEIAGQRAEN